MHGIEQVKRMNEDPNAYHAAREPQHYGEGSTPRATDETLQKILEEITGGRQKSARLSAADIIGMLVVAATLEDATRSIPRTLADRPRQHMDARHLGMDGVLSAIDAAPPFLKFWHQLNAERSARCEDEATYKEAREAFQGGPTPDGALTFIGKKWDGLRAVPVGAVQGRPTYHGEFRQVTDNGTIWRTVHSQSGPIAYATPEAALGGALLAKAHMEATKS